MSSFAPLVELSEVAKFVRGITFKPEDKVEPFSDGSIVCFRTKNVQAEIDQEDLIAVPRRFAKRIEQIVQAGDILVSTANSWELVGKCSWVPQLDYEATIGGFISLLRGKPDRVELRYLYHWFNTPETQLAARYCGRQTTNISNMDIGQAERLRLPLPPLPEQRRIAAILDAADGLRAKRRAALAKLDALLQAVFLEMFGDPVGNERGWETRCLDEVCLSKGTYGSGASAIPYDHNKPRYIRITDINDDGSLSDNRVSPSTDESDWRANALNDGDIVFARSGATVGKTYLYRSADGLSVYAGYLIRFRPNPMVILPEFLFSYTKTEAYRAWVQSRMKVVAQPNINAKQYGQELLLPVPPLSLQQRYVARVNRIQAQRSWMLSQSHEMDLLFASLQRSAFAGGVKEKPVAGFSSETRPQD